MPAASLVHYSNDFFSSTSFSLALSLSCFPPLLSSTRPLALSILSIEWEHTHNYSRACACVCSLLMRYVCANGDYETGKKHDWLSSTLDEERRNERMNERDWGGNYGPWTNWKQNHLAGTLSSVHSRVVGYTYTYMYRERERDRENARKEQIPRLSTCLFHYNLFLFRKHTEWDYSRPESSLFSLLTRAQRHTHTQN